MLHPRVVANLRRPDIGQVKVGKGFFLAERGDVQRFKLRHVLCE